MTDKQIQAILDAACLTYKNLMDIQSSLAFYHHEITEKENAEEISIEDIQNLLHWRTMFGEAEKAWISANTLFVNLLEINGDGDYAMGFFMKEKIRANENHNYDRLVTCGKIIDFLAEHVTLHSYFPIRPNGHTY